MSNLARKRTDFAYSIEDTLKQYLALKARIESLEQALNASKEELEIAVSHSGGSLEVGTYKLHLIDCTRETFRLKEAKLHIEQVLKPYISHSQYTQLRVTAKKAA